MDGIFATGYPLSDGEILTPGSLYLPESFTTREPEVLFQTPRDLATPGDSRLTTVLSTTDLSWLT